MLSPLQSAKCNHEQVGEGRYRSACLIVSQLNFYGMRMSENGAVLRADAIFKVMTGHHSNLSGTSQPTWNLKILSPSASYVAFVQRRTSQDKMVAISERSSQKSWFHTSNGEPVLYHHIPAFPCQIHRHEEVSCLLQKSCGGRYMCYPASGVYVCNFPSPAFSLNSWECTGTWGPYFWQKSIILNRLLMQYGTEKDGEGWHSEVRTGLLSLACLVRS